MIRRYRAIFLILALLVQMGTQGCSDEQPPQQAAETPEQPVEKTLVFNGGPAGGTFNYFANKMASLISDNANHTTVHTRASAGSQANLCALNTGQADFAILYSGDAFLGRSNRIDCEHSSTDKTRALAFLYDAPAQLAVRKNSGIETVYDLEGKTIATGNPGSGAALSAERFFEHLKLWDHMDRRAIGYSQAADEFAKGEVDGFWILAGFPNASVIEASTQTDVILLDLHTPALENGFYETYPFYRRMIIPAHTYDGQTDDVASFSDAALWCVRADLDEGTVYLGMQSIFSQQGVTEMEHALRGANRFTIASALEYVSIPLHKGAASYWGERGVNIPHRLLPK